MHQDERGHAMTTDSTAAGEALDGAIHNLLHWRAAVIPNLKAALEADADFGLGHAVTGLILHGARNVHFRPKIAQSLEAAKAAAPRLTTRERLYVAALEAAYEGRITQSVTCYEQILSDHPRDLMAQRLAQMELFWIGEMSWSETISAQCADAWDETVPSYGIHLSCRAFDLEETLQFDAAERLGRQAVEIDPTDVWGTHAVAHVLIMQGRHGDGIAWLEGLKDRWAEANQMSLHLWWHRCLFHLERGEFDAVLAIYDDWVRNRELDLLQSMPDLYIDLQNGASLLLRLELRGVEVGGRWAEMAELALNRLEDHTSPFTSPHFALILAASGRFDEAATLVASMRAFAAADEGTFGPRYRSAAIPAAEAAIAHRKGEHDKVVATLMPARRLLWQMGGSHAQRDLFFLMLADSAQRLERPDLLQRVLRDLAACGFSDPESRIGYRDAVGQLH